jgi:hypothetical protein
MIGTMMSASSNGISTSFPVEKSAWRGMAPAMWTRDLSFLT